MVKEGISAGLVFVYIRGEEENGMLQIRVVDTYSHIGDGFYQQVHTHAYAEGCEDAVHLFAVVGVKEKAEQLYQVTSDELKENFDRLLSHREIQKTSSALDAMGNTFFKSVQEFFCGAELHFSRSCGRDFSEFVFRGICCSGPPEESADQLVEDIISLWVEHEQPELCGRQLMLRSFFMRDLVGRKIVACLPETRTKVWSLILEGGQQILMDAEMSYQKETVSPDELGAFCASDVQSVLLNPIYAYGLWFYPNDLCEQWHKVFLYICAITQKEWTPAEITEVYERFLAFLQEHICNTMEAPATISKGMYCGALLRHIQRFRSYLKGEDEPVLSKDLHQTLNSRYVYLPYLWNLFPHEKKQTSFSLRVFRTHMNQALTASSNYEKGTLWETAVEYMLKHISGWKITGRRIRAGSQEIDISVVNISLQDDLWQLGAYILIECKNWDSRIDLQQIRNIAHVSNMKGNKTALLFTSNGVTRDAEDEIRRLANENLYIVHISAKDLLRIEQEADCKRMILDKWQRLKQEVDAFPMI